MTYIIFCLYPLTISSFLVFFHLFSNILFSIINVFRKSLISLSKSRSLVAISHSYIHCYSILIVFFIIAVTKNIFLVSYFLSLSRLLLFPFISFYIYALSNLLVCKYLLSTLRAIQFLFLLIHKFNFLNFFLHLSAHNSSIFNSFSITPLVILF